LFGVTDADASISNVGLINVDISNANYNRSTGGLVGLNYGIISNSHVTGSVSGYSKVGGLVGVNQGIVSNSYVTGDVSGDYDIGGLVGTSYGGSITNSYATGVVTGDDSVGGLVGSNYGGNINHSYASGSVEGTDKVGGLVGSNYGGNINHSYASGSVEGTGKVGGLVGYNEGTLNNSFYNAATVQINGATFVDEDGMPNDDGILTVGGLYGEQYRTWIRGDKTLNPAAANSDGFIEINNLQNFKDMLGFSQKAGLSFIQTADIDLNNDVGLFVPYFAGQFNGDGYSISNATINVAINSNIGLFGDLRGSLQGVTALNVEVSGNRNVGGLVGRVASDASIVDGVVSGAVEGINANAGGLAGSNHGDISYSAANVTVDGSQAYNVGGLVGFNNGLINDVEASGAVIASANVGGLVGTNYGSILMAEANGDVTGSADYIGGLVGMNNGMIANGVATGNVIGNDYVGGLVGLNSANRYDNTNASITNSRAGGSVGGQDYVGGLVGSNSVEINLSNANYADVLLTASIENSYASGNVTGSNYVGGLVGQSASIVQLQGTASLSDSVLIASIVDSHATGDVSGDDFIGGLVGGNVVDVEIADSSIATNLTANAIVSGTFAVGSVDGLDRVGGLVGVNKSNLNGSSDSSIQISALINDSYATGIVFGRDYVGGLVGYNYGQVKRSYANATALGSSYVGGLVGYAYDGAIENSYATGSVLASGDYAGGLVGKNASEISQAYASGQAIGFSNAGGLVGDNTGTVSNSFWNTDSSGTTQSASGIGLTNEQMMQLASYSDWSIDSDGRTNAVWRIYEGYSAPLLRGFMENISLLDTTVSYNGAIQSGDRVPNGRSGTTAEGLNVGTYSSFSDQQGYNIVGGLLTIEALPVSVTGTRVYDGSIDLDVSIFDISGLLDGETLTLNGIGLMNDKHVGFDKTVIVDRLVLSDCIDTGCAGLASNYTFSGGTQTVTITQKSLMQSGLSVASSKVYDGTTDAVVLGSASFGSQDVGLGDANDGMAYNGDTVSITGAVIGTYNDKDVVDATTVSFSGMSLAGADANNYSLLAHADAAATITQKSLTQSGLSVANSKVYDSTTDAVVLGSVSLQRIAANLADAADGAAIVGDDVSLVGTAIGAYNDKDVADATSVAFSGVSLSGADSSNYSLEAHADAAASITQKSLTQSGLSVASSKVYDGTTDAVVIGNVSLQTVAANLANANDGAVIVGDDVSLVGTAMGAYNDKDAADAMRVTISGLSLNGADVNNYSFAAPVLLASITPKALSQSGLSVASSKVYDGTRNAVLLGSASFASQDVGLGDANDGIAYNGDTVSISGTLVGTYNDKDVADATTVSFSGMSLTGANAGNYNLLAHANAAATITPADAVVTASSGTRYYNGLTRSISSFSASGLKNGESSSVLTGVSAFGSGVEIGTYPVVASGTDGNYHLTFIDGLLTIEQGAPAAFLSVIGASLNSLSKADEAAAVLTDDSADDAANAADEKVKLPDNRMTSLRVSVKD
jgi:hypothetical protein